MVCNLRDVGGVFLTCLGLTVLAAGWARGQDQGPWLVAKKIVVDPEAWKWNWAAWDQEKIATFGDFQYTVYWDSDRIMVLVRRDLRNDQIETLRLPMCTLRSDDRHRNTCLGISPADGRLHLSWDHHCDPLRYTKSRAGLLTNPPAQLSAADIEAPAPMLSKPELESRVTYPTFFNDPAGNLYLVYRIGASGNGDSFLHRYDPKSASWTRLGMLFSSKGAYAPWENSQSRCAYPHDLLFDKQGRLHVTWTFREVGQSWASNHDLHYAYSDDRGLTWCNNAGEKIADLTKGDPIELSDPGIVVREIPVYSWLMNTGCMALDSHDQPHVITFKSRVIHRPEKLKHNPPEIIAKELRFNHYWRSEDGQWHETELPDPAAFGVKRGDMVLDDKDNITFFWPSPKGFACLSANASDNWQSWRLSPLTGPDITGWDASKHDRLRWDEKRVLSFTAKPGDNGFAIVDLTPAEDRR